MTTVLIVDDSALDRKIVGAILERDGLHVTYAEDGKIALEVMQRELPQIVLTDLEMPVMNGLELVRAIKEHYPSTPVVLVTGAGSEEIAAEALRAGAATYVPKRCLQDKLPEAISMLESSVESAREQEMVRSFLQRSESEFICGYETGAAKALIGHALNLMTDASICDASDHIRVGTALAEALTNAIEHGNLELDSALREDDSQAYKKVGQERAKRPPYRDRRVYFKVLVRPDEITFVVRDEGPGFDVDNLADPTDPDNLSKPSGRGVMLIRTFMDEVRFNATGNEITMVKRNSERRGSCSNQ